MTSSGLGLEGDPIQLNYRRGVRELAEERKHPRAPKKPAKVVGCRRAHRYLSRYEAKLRRYVMMCVSTALSIDPTNGAPLFKGVVLTI